MVFHLHAQGRIPPFAFDSGQIRQVLINLSRRPEAMPEGGDLTVSAEVQDDDLVLKITDTGHGIAPEQLQNLFTPFFTTKEGGTGLGLTSAGASLPASGRDPYQRSPWTAAPPEITIRLPSVSGHQPASTDGQGQGSPRGREAGAVRHRPSTVLAGL